jgi:hypothetical protein
VPLSDVFDAHCLSTHVTAISTTFHECYWALYHFSIKHINPSGDDINLLKPTAYVMHQQFNIQQLYALPTLYLCVLYLSEKNSDLCHLQHKMIGLYNQDEKFLQRGTNWVCK